MLNKNKKRMVKLFLLVFIILISYNIIIQKVFAEGACCSISWSAGSNTGFSCEDTYNFYVGNGAGELVKATKENVADDMSCTPYSTRSRDVNYRGTVSINAHCKKGSESGRERCVKDGTTSIESTGTKQCTIWQPSWERCDECDDDGDCTKYECRSLGQDCNFDEGTSSCAKSDCSSNNVCGGAGDLNGNGICDTRDDDMDGDSIYNDQDAYPCDSTRSQKEVIKDTEGPEIRTDKILVNQDATNFDLVIEARDLVSGIKNCRYSVNDEVTDLEPGAVTNGWKTFSKNSLNLVDTVHVTCFDIKENSNTIVVTITKISDLKVSFPEYFNEDKGNNVVDNKEDEITIPSNRLTKCGFKIDNGNLIYFKDIETKDWTTSHVVKLYKFFENKPDGSYNILIQCWEDVNNKKEKGYDVDVNFNAYNNINFDDYPIGDEPSSIRGIKGSFIGGVGAANCLYTKLNGNNLNEANNNLNTLEYNSLTNTINNDDCEDCGAMSVVGDKNKWDADSKQLEQNFLGRAYYYGIICQDSSNSWIKLKKVIEVKNYFPSFSIIISEIINLVEGPLIEDATLTLSGRSSEAECRFKQTGSGVSDVEWNNMELLGTKVWNNERIILPVNGVLIAGDINLHFKCRGIPDEENEAPKKIPVSVSYPDDYMGLELGEFECLGDCDKKEQTWGLYTSGAEATKDDKCYYICDNMDGYSDIFDGINSNTFSQFDSGKDNYGFYHKHTFIIKEGFSPNINYDCWVYCKTRDNYIPGELNMETPDIEIKDVILNPDPNGKAISSNELSITLKTDGGFNNQHECRITNNIDEFSSIDKDDLFYGSIDYIRSEIDSETFIYNLQDKGIKYDRGSGKSLRNHVITIPIKQNDDGSVKHYQLAIQCKDEADQYTRDSSGNIRVAGNALVDFDVDFNDLKIDLIKPINEVQGKDVDVIVNTREGDSGEGKANSCNINSINFVRSRNRDGEGFLFKGRLEDLSSGTNEFSITCEDSNKIIYTKNVDFDVVLNAFEIAGEQKTIDGNKAVLSFVGKYGVNGYGKGYCTYDLNKAGSGSISIDAFDISNEGGYGNSESTTYSKILFLDKGVYSVNVICYDSRGENEIGRKDNYFVFEIKAEAGQITNKYIGPDDVGKKCGDIVITNENIGKYCCSDGTIKNNEAECVKVEPSNLDRCAPTICNDINKCKCTNIKCDKYNQLIAKDENCGAEKGLRNVAITISDEGKIITTKSELDAFDLTVDAKETGFDCKYAIKSGKYTYKDIYPGFNELNDITNIGRDGKIHWKLFKEAFNVVFGTTSINNGDYGVYIRCEKEGVYGEKDTFFSVNIAVPQVDCADSKYNAGQQTCTSVGCKWSGENYRCNRDCYTDWTDANNDKICESPTAKSFTVTIATPQDETTITQLPVELKINTQKEASCSYIKGSRNVFDEYIDIEAESLQEFDQISLSKKQFIKNLGSLTNNKYTYHVHCDAIDGSNDYGDAYVDFNVNIAGAVICNTLTTQTSCTTNNCKWSSSHGCDTNCYDGWIDINPTDRICEAPEAGTFDVRIISPTANVNTASFDLLIEIDEGAICSYAKASKSRLEEYRDTEDAKSFDESYKGKHISTLTLTNGDYSYHVKCTKTNGDEGNAYVDFSVNIGGTVIPSVGECKLNNDAEWLDSDGNNIPNLRISDGNEVVLYVTGSNNCEGKTIKFIIKKDIKFSRDSIEKELTGVYSEEEAVAFWDTVYDSDNYLRGYYFVAEVDKNSVESDRLVVTRQVSDNTKTRLDNCNINTICGDIDGCICLNNCVKTEIEKDENCGGILGACTNQAIDSQPTGCTGSNYCDGNGNCVSMYWKYYGSGPVCRPSNTIFKTCKPSNVGIKGDDIERDSVGLIDSLHAYDESAPMGQIWCDEYECAIGNPTILICYQGIAPEGNGVLMGVSNYSSGYQTHSWTYRSDNRVLGACEWSCSSGYAKSDNGCVAVVAVQPCVISSINWVNKDGTTRTSAYEGETVYGIIRGTNCVQGTSINYEIKEKDMIFGVDELAADDTIISSTPVAFQTNNIASITWQEATRQNDLAAPYNWYYIKINDNESSLLEVKEIVPDARRTVLEECNINCNDPDGCTCPSGCSITGDINRRENCGQAVADITPPQIIQIVSKSARNYILTNEKAICYASTNKNGPWDNGLSREGSNKHLITLSEAYYIKCIDTAGNWGGIVNIS